MTKTSSADAAPRCQHIKDSGRLCGSPALRAQPFCYNHFRIHQPPTDPKKNPMAFIPYLETGQAMQIAVTNIARAVCTGQLDAKQANAIFNGMRLLKTAFEYRYPMADGPEMQTITPAMAEVLATSYAASREETEEEIKVEEQKNAGAEKTVPTAVILNEDARPSEGPQQSSMRTERPGIFNRNTLSQIADDHATTTTPRQGEVETLRPHRVNGEGTPPVKFPPSPARAG